MFVTAAWIALLAQGPISKFTDRQPDKRIVSTRKLEDIERCLIDMRGWLVPHVFRQPDQPDAAILVWTAPNGLAGARVDLARRKDGTDVTAWMPAKQVSQCAE